MKYFVGNIIALIICSVIIIYPIWLMSILHWSIKAVLSLLIFIAVAFFVERYVSKIVNKVVGTIFPREH